MSDPKPQNPKTPKPQKYGSIYYKNRNLKALLYNSFYNFIIKMKFILSATILVLLQNSISCKEHDFEIDFDYYESRNPVDIYRSNKMKKGGKRRALNHDAN